MFSGSLRTSMEHSVSSTNRTITQDFQLPGLSCNSCEVLEDGDHIRDAGYDTNLGVQDTVLPPYSAIDPLKNTDANLAAGAPSVSTLPTTGRLLAELPIELWDIILREIDDHRTLYACLCTCHAFHDLGISILVGRQQIDITCRYDSYDLSLRLCHDPLLAYLLGRVSIGTSELPAFAIEFCGRLHNIRVFWIFGSPEPRMGHGPGIQSRLALTKFTSVTSLALYEVEFATFTDCMRLLCAFRSLRHLNMYNTRYVSESCGSVCVTQMPFTQTLKLKKLEVKVDYNSAISPIYRHLLLSPRLAQTLEELAIKSYACILDSTVSSAFDSRHYERHEEFQNLHKLSLSINMLDPCLHHIYAPLESLKPVVTRNLKSISISLPLGLYTAPKFSCASEDRNISTYFQALDDFFDSPQFPCLENIHITLESLHAEDVEHILAMPSHRLPFPALRRWELLTLEISERHNRTPSRIVISHRGGQL